MKFRDFLKYLSAAVPRINITLANHSENTALLVILPTSSNLVSFFPQMRALRTRHHESIALAIVRNAVNLKNIACGHHLMNSTPAASQSSAASRETGAPYRARQAVASAVHPPD